MKKMLIIAALAAALGFTVTGCEKESSTVVVPKDNTPAQPAPAGQPNQTNINKPADTKQ